MKTLREKLSQSLPKLRDELKALSRDHGSLKLGDVTVEQLIGGMRGIKALLCDTSIVTPDDGLIVRGTPIAKLADRLPEELFYLLLAGELPNAEELKALQNDLMEHATVPGYVWDVLHSMPENSHPMTMLVTAIMIMQDSSHFFRRYNDGMGKNEFMEPALLDSIELLGKLPTIAAGIYRIRFHQGDIIEPNKKLDWASNYVHMLGLEDAKGHFAKLMQLFLTLHCDHESGNASAFTNHVVSSALSDPYYSAAAGLCALAGPLHGVANQECLKFVQGIQEKFGGVPTDAQMKQFTLDTLNAGRVIPGYGHAVLRVTDPRFTAFHEFGKKYCANDELFQIVDRLLNVVPTILKEQGKAKSIWPNVDAGSGGLLFHFGLKEPTYYTVCFGVSRAMGFLSQYVIDRGIGAPICRPKSVSTDWLKQQVKAATK